MPTTLFRGFILLFKYFSRLIFFPRVPSYTGESNLIYFLMDAGAAVYLYLARSSHHTHCTQYSWPFAEIAPNNGQPVCSRPTIRSLCFVCDDVQQVLSPDMKSLYIFRPLIDTPSSSSFLRSLLPTSRPFFFYRLFTVSPSSVFPHKFNVFVIDFKFVSARIRDKRDASRTFKSLNVHVCVWIFNFFSWI